MIDIQALRAITSAICASVTRRYGLLHQFDESLLEDMMQSGVLACLEAEDRGRQYSVSVAV